MGVSGASGTTIAIGTTATVGATDTFTTLGSVASIGEFGISFGQLKFEDLGTGFTSKFKGARDDGSVALGLGKDMTDAGQVALLAALLVKDDYNFKVTYNDSSAVISAVVTISIAAPGVVTWTANGLPVNTPVKFTNTGGALPTGLVSGTTYFIKTILTADTFTVSATVGGSAITTTGTTTGVNTGTTVPAPSSDIFKAKVTGYKTNVGSLSTTLAAAVTLDITTGSLATTARIP